MPNIPLNNFLKNVLDEAIKEGRIETARKMLDFSKGSFQRIKVWILYWIKY